MILRRVLYRVGIRSCHDMLDDLIEQEFLAYGFKLSTGDLSADDIFLCGLDRFDVSDAEVGDALLDALLYRVHHARVIGDLDDGFFPGAGLFAKRGQPTFTWAVPPLPHLLILIKPIRV